MTIRWRSLNQYSRVDDVHLHPLYLRSTFRRTGRYWVLKTTISFFLSCLWPSVEYQRGCYWSRKSKYRSRSSREGNKSHIMVQVQVLTLFHLLPLKTLGPRTDWTLIPWDTDEDLRSQTSCKGGEWDHTTTVNGQGQPFTNVKSLFVSLYLSFYSF